MWWLIQLEMVWLIKRIFGGSLEVLSSGWTLESFTAIRSKFEILVRLKAIFLPKSARPYFCTLSCPLQIPVLYSVLFLEERILRLIQDCLAAAVKNANKMNHSSFYGGLIFFMRSGWILKKYFVLVLFLLLEERFSFNHLLVLKKSKKCNI